jgi:hypothetical protein
VGVVEWGGRTVEVVVVDAAGVVAGVAGAGRKSGTRRFRRCLADTAEVGEIGNGEIVRKRPVTELNARETDDDEGDAGVEEAEGS